MRCSPSPLHPVTPSSPRLCNPAPPRRVSHARLQTMQSGKTKVEAAKFMRSEKTHTQNLQTVRSEKTHTQSFKSCAVRQDTHTAWNYCGQKRHTSEASNFLRSEKTHMQNDTTTAAKPRLLWSHMLALTTGRHVTTQNQINRLLHRPTSSATLQAFSPK